MRLERACQMVATLRKSAVQRRHVHFESRRPLPLLAGKSPRLLGQPRPGSRASRPNASRQCAPPSRCRTGSPTGGQSPQNGDSTRRCISTRAFGTYSPIHNLTTASTRRRLGGGTQPPGSWSEDAERPITSGRHPVSPAARRPRVRSRKRIPPRDCCSTARQAKLGPALALARGISTVGLRHLLRAVSRAGRFDRPPAAGRARGEQEGWGLDRRSVASRARSRNVTGPVGSVPLRRR
jgi:hypothetical protein